MTRSAKYLTAAAGALALVCLIAITAMAFSANQSRKADAAQDFHECLARSAGLDVRTNQVCIDRYKAGAK